MSDGITVKINTAQFRAEIEALGVKVERRITAAAVRAAARVFRDAAKSRAPRLRKSDPRRNAGALAAAVTIFRPRRSERGTVVYSVGVRASKVQKRAGSDPFYWRFLEGGWVPRGRGQKLRGGSRRRALERTRLAASGARRYQYPFLAPAFQAQGGAALAAFELAFAEALAKEKSTL